MRGNHQVSPLDHTLDALERLSVLMRRSLEQDELLTREDFGAILVFVEGLARELKPLQEAKIEEQR